MKKIILFGAALLSLFTTSCNKDNVMGNGNELATGKTITLNATINNGADTKLTYIDNGSSVVVSWSDDETFTLYRGTNSAGETFTKTSASGNMFSGNDITGTGKYYAVYGQGISNTDGTLTIDLSGAQMGTKEEKGIKEFMLASADALNSSTTLEFSHMLTVLKLTLTLPEGEKGTTVNNLTISGLHNKACYKLGDGSYAYADTDLKDITATNGSTGFAITNHQITAYVAVFPEKVSPKQVKITAKVGDNEYAYTIEAGRELVMGNVTSVVTTLYWTKNLKAVYTTADYYAWDAKTPYSLNGGTQFAGVSSVAQYSCKYTPNKNQIAMYLGAGVYWDKGDEDDNQQTYQLPNGSISHKGLWVMKKEYIIGFSEDEANKVFEVSPTVNSDLWHAGRPAAEEIGKYFFLPAVGHYWGNSYSNDTDYWLSFAYDNEYAGRLSISAETARYNGGTAGYSCLPMVAE